MSNGDTQCCVIEACCGGPQSKATEAFASWLQEYAGLNVVDALRVAKAVKGTYALAPLEFAAVAEAIGKLVRAHPEYNK